MLNSPERARHFRCDVTQADALIDLGTSKTRPSDRTPRTTRTGRPERSSTTIAMLDDDLESDEA